MSIIGVQIAAAEHDRLHPERIRECIACDMRANDWDAANANFHRQQAEAERKRFRL